MPAEVREQLLCEAQRILQALGDAVTATEAAIQALTKAAPPSSRAGYLRPLEDLLPRPVSTDVTEDVCRAIVEEVKIPQSRLQLWLPKAHSERNCAFISEIARATGLPHHDAADLDLLTSNVYSAPLGRALRAGDIAYAAPIHRLNELVTAAAKNQTGSGGGTLPRKLFLPLKGNGSLMEADPAWAQLEHADAAGLRSVLSSVVVTAGCHPDALTPAGYSRLLVDGTSETVDSPIVCFESEEPNVGDGTAHAAVMLTDTYGVFPPNTLFTLKEVLPAPFQAVNSRGETVTIHQTCFRVGATYLPPVASAGQGVSGKMVAAPLTLHYGERSSYIAGVQDLIQKPSLTMLQEFSRDSSWKDWKGVSYSLRECWQYVTGPASRKEGCTPGTRDDNNEGKTPEQFQDETNHFITERRRSGLGTNLPESYALLTRDEVLAVRLYSGPAYQPLNGFLRQVSHLSGDFRKVAGKDVRLTFSATVGHLCHAIRKLAAVATAEEAQRPLFRGVRGELPNSFWHPDKQGFVCATDCAFMSVSRNRQTPIDYMGLGHNVLWRLAPGLETPGAFHYGADISGLSQFAGEEEILFPPCTMLVASTEGESRKDLEEAEKAEEGTFRRGETGHDISYTAINVRPFFV